MSPAEQSSITRSSPHSVEAEQAVLGSMLLSRKAIGRAIETIPSSEYFYRDTHRTIYDTILEMFNDDQQVDELTVAEELEKNNQLETIGGASYLAELMNTVPHAANVEHYAEIVKEKYVNRALIETCTEIIEKAYEEREEVDELLDESEGMIFQIKKDQVEQGLSPVGDIIDETVEELDEAHEQDGVITGLKTGFSNFDSMTSGFQENQLVIMAARPGMGKTSLALTMTRNIGLSDQAPVAIFSLEMSKSALVKRLLSSESKIPYKKLSSGKLSDSDFKRLSNAMARLNEAPIYLDDTPSLNVIDMKAKTRRLKSEHGLGLAIVDYLQLMDNVGSPESREQELATISRGLKELAMELGIPVMALTQLNRQLEHRNDKRPKLSDLRGSGAIEQDADIVSFVYRDYVYTQKEEDRGHAELIIGKQRNGPTGTINLSFIEDRMTFEEMTRRDEPPEI
ncbi:MAG: replicative DNA helicase [bacterium]